MASPASISKHPIHPMLVALPIGLWIFSLASDVIYAMGWGGATWKETALYTMAGGIVGALFAAVPGLIDLLSITNSKVKKIGIWHMSLNLVAVALYAINFWCRYSASVSAGTTIWLSVIGLALLGITGWLGGEMVYVHGMAVEPQPSVERSTERGTPRRAA